MELLNTYLSQIANYYQTLSAGMRVAGCTLLVILALAGAYLYQSPVPVPDTYLFGGAEFHTSDLTAMETAFSVAGLNHYELEGSKIKIPREQQQAYISALAGGDALPTNVQRMFEQASDKSKFYESKDQRQKREIATKQQMLSLLIGDMPDIESAVVLHAGVEGTTLFNGSSTATASVTVKPVGKKNLERSRVPGIRELVAKSLPGLTVERVSVIDQNSGKVYSGSSLDSDIEELYGLGDLYSEQKRHYEQLYQRNIEQALAYIPGVIVSTNVELGQTLPTDSPQPGPLKPTTSGSISSGSNTQLVLSAASPTPIPTSGVNAAAAIGSKDLDSTPNISTNISASVTSPKETQSPASHAGFSPTQKLLVPDHVSVSIGIPSRYYEQLWLQIHRGLDPQDRSLSLEELEKMEIAENQRILEYALRLIPAPRDQTIDPRSLVNVSRFTQLSDQPVTPAFNFQQLTTWLSTPQGIVSSGLFSLLIVSAILLSLRGKSSKHTDPTLIAFPEPESHYEETRSTNNRPAYSLHRNSSPTLKEELVDIVREDPDAAANILRSWINKAS